MSCCSWKIPDPNILLPFPRLAWQGFIDSDHLFVDVSAAILSRLNTESSRGLLWDLPTLGPRTCSPSVLSQLRFLLSNTFTPHPCCSASLPSRAMSTLLLTQFRCSVSVVDQCLLQFFLGFHCGLLVLLLPPHIFLSALC